MLWKKRRNLTHRSQRILHAHGHCDICFKRRRGITGGALEGWQQVKLLDGILCEQSVPASRSRFQGVTATGNCSLSRYCTIEPSCPAIHVGPFTWPRCLNLSEIVLRVGDRSSLGFFQKKIVHGPLHPFPRREEGLGFGFPILFLYPDGLKGNLCLESCGEIKCEAKMIHIPIIDWRCECDPNTVLS